jgi:hypothetical protein
MHVQTVAKECLQSWLPHSWVSDDRISRVHAVSVHFDGGHKDGRRSSAWTMSAAGPNASTWHVVANAAVSHPIGATSVSPEMFACWQAVQALTSRQFLLHGEIQFNADGAVLQT